MTKKQKDCPRCKHVMEWVWNGLFFIWECTHCGGLDSGIPDDEGEEE